LKSMEGSLRNRPANGSTHAPSMASGERQSELRERERGHGRGVCRGRCTTSMRRTGRSGRARRSACGGDRLSSVTEQVKQSHRGSSAAPSGLSARQGVTIIPPKRNLVLRFRVKLQKLKRERKVRYLDKFVATQDTWIEQILPSPKWLLARSDYSIAPCRNCWFDSE
jgi:hypothetical protein